MTNKKMPVLFVSHGSPMLALDNEKGEEFLKWGKNLPKPKAILVFSAHWETDALAFGQTSTHHNLVYDFSGFPQALYDVQYPAPGANDLTELIAPLLNKINQINVINRSLDHGVWVPFSHMWPKADIPVLQMTMPFNFSNKALFELGQQLRPLRQQGVLISTNGTLTHNLQEWNPRHSGIPEKWAQEFDEWVKEALITSDVDALLNWQQLAPQAKRNHPTAEHFRPLLIAAGAGLAVNGKNETIRFPIEGFEYGIFSKRSVQFG